MRARPQTAAEANVSFYAEMAETYDATEEVVADPTLRARMMDVLERSLALLPPEPRALDACGGSGNVSLALLELGVRPVTVDISPEMLAIYERKAHAAGFEVETTVTEIADFLETDERTWDLVVFSSALHHLDDFEAVLDAATRRLAPGGVIVTVFDPTRANPVVRRLRRLEYVLHVLVKTPARVPHLVATRLRQRRGATDTVTSAGELAERHALAGIDDLALARRLEAAGLRVLVHDRRYDARFRPVAALYRLLRQPSSFDFVAQRPAGDGAPTGDEHGSSDREEVRAAGSKPAGEGYPSPPRVR